RARGRSNHSGSSEGLEGSAQLASARRRSRLLPADHRPTARVCFAARDARVSVHRRRAAACGRFLKEDTMASNSARIRTTVGVIIGIALVGVFACRKEPDRTMSTAPAKKHLILVGPTADHLSEDEYSVSMSDPREVIWLSIEKQKLGIRFPVDQPKL